jgi:pimeloyl-ACP methyl ester carboxylesterase
MNIAKINDVDIAYEIAGSGDPLVLVNGGFLEHTQWMLVVPLLAESFRVVTFDLPGHGQSTGNVEDPVAVLEDITMLVETLDVGPAHVHGQSGGGLIALQLAARRPDLLRSVSVHEPAVMGLLTGAGATAAQEIFAVTASKIRAGDTEGALSAFMEFVGGDWSLVPQPFQAAMCRNAASYGPSFGDLTHPIWHLDASAIARFPHPIQLTRGDQSPPWLQDLSDCVEKAIAGIEVTVIEDAGHMAMVDQPARYAAALTAFIERTR